MLVKQICEEATKLCGKLAVSVTVELNAHKIIKLLLERKPEYTEVKPSTVAAVAVQLSAALCGKLVTTTLISEKFEKDKTAVSKARTGILSTLTGQNCSAAVVDLEVLKREICKFGEEGL